MHNLPVLIVQGAFICGVACWPAIYREAGLRASLPPVLGSLPPSLFLDATDTFIWQHPSSTTDHVTASPGAFICGVACWPAIYREAGLRASLPPVLGSLPPSLFLDATDTFIWQHPSSTTDHVTASP
ncbi:hypothetical protein V5799_011679, partial [Amblyomma americanum]